MQEFDVTCPLCKRQELDVEYNSILRTVWSCECGYMIDLAELAGDVKIDNSFNIKRLFFIRHIRWFWNFHKLHRHIEKCMRLGLGFFPQERDLLHIQNIWHGKA